MLKPWPILNLPEVKVELADVTIENIEFESENVSTTWAYEARFHTRATGLGQEGPSTRPCGTTVEIQTIGGVAGTEISEPKIETICAENFPMQI